jgi:selenide,water dikinase
MRRVPREHSRELVLVGGGHAHVQVLRRFAMRGVPGVRLTVVLDVPEAVYSGMVPGCVAGDYRAAELAIDVVPLARRAGARVVLAPALRIDPALRRIELEGRPALPYDLASLDVGSTVRGLELPGVREHALATRPIGGFVRELEGRLRDAASPRHAGPLRVAVVGAGVAGVELSFCLEARLRAAGVTPEIHLLGDAADLAPGQPPGLVLRARREAARRGIELHLPARVVAVEKDAVRLEGEDERVASELVVWATGAAPPPLLASSPLPRDERGFVRVAETLEVVGCEGLFAVGDCAALGEHPWVPRAGVYAVREGPILAANLRARLAGGRLRRYRPQRDFLALLNLGERRALGAKRGVAFAGRFVWRWKDRIDRRFVERFRLLAEDGTPALGSASLARSRTQGSDGASAGALPGGGPAHAPASMGAQAAMECGGCAAKLGAPELARGLARLPRGPADPTVLLGLDPPDDAAALRLPGGALLLATLDAFRAFADDPWLVGRVAAVNAASDVFAKGGRPRHALALVTVPEREPARAEETLYQVLAGMRAGLDPLGVSLVGGHTTAGGELFVGLAVLGELAPGEPPLALGGARPGEDLVLTKPLGTGVVLAADMRGLARGVWLEAAIASMLRPNGEAARVARAFGAGGATDVSGFGLAGHLAELARASGVVAELRLAALPALDGALGLLARGVRSTFHAQNARLRASLALDPAAERAPALELLFDPQTSGGLLFGVVPDRSSEAVRALHEAGDARAGVIGRLHAGRAGEPPVVVRAEG